jgi:hypothetical protein
MQEYIINYDIYKSTFENAAGAIKMHNAEKMTT